VLKSIRLKIDYKTSNWQKLQYINPNTNPKVIFIALKNGVPLALSQKEIIWQRL